MRKLMFIFTIALLTAQLAQAVGTVTGGATATNKPNSLFNAGNMGTPLLGVRNDADATLATTNLGYGPLSIDPSGKIKTTATVTAVLAEVATAASGSQTNGSSLFKLIAGVDATGLTKPIKTSTLGEVFIYAPTLPLPAGAATIAEQVTGNASLSSIDTKVSSLATAAKQDTGNTSLSSIDTKASATNTSLSSIDTKQDVATSTRASESTLSTLSGKVPANLTVTSTRLLVDGSGVTQPVSGTVAVTGTVTTVAPSAASSTTAAVSNSVVSFTALASNASRKGAVLFNNSTTDCVYKFGATASSSSFAVKLFAGDTLTMDPPTYTGVIDAICTAATGTTQVTEL